MGNARTPRGWFVLWALAAMLLALSVVSGDTVSAAGNSIEHPDPQLFDGLSPSLVVDAGGNPVIAHAAGLFDPDLKVVHCDDPNCAGTELGVFLDAQPATAFTRASIELDAAGNPVVAYQDAAGNVLKLVHCGSPACTGNTITSLSTGSDLSLELDGAGNPVISFQSGSGELSLLHCGDATCSSGNSTASPDTNTAVGSYNSLALDGSGRPVISYYDGSNGNLKLLHCGNANCTSGNSTASPDTAMNVGRYTALALDGSGRPVVSYYDLTNSALKLLHCGNANCTAGNSIATLDSNGIVGEHTSLALDSSGNPVISYYDRTKGDLKVIHCDDPDCTSTYSIASPETAGDVGNGTSLALDASGYPIVAYRDESNERLSLLHCTTSTCKGPTVGGIAELPDADSAAPLEVAGSAEISTGVLVGIAAAATVLAFGTGAWVVRRRRH